MRFFVRVTSDGDGWRVRVGRDSSSGGLAPDRLLRRVTTSTDPNSGFAYPLPSEAEVAALSGPARLSELWRADNAGELHKLYVKIATRDAVTAEEVEIFGCYLFSTLLGPDTWQAVGEGTKDGKVELLLTFPPEEPTFTRLPWEMMRSPNGYLAAQSRPAVSITRMVSSQTGVLGDFTILPKVLFVVGTELSDAQLRAGAEYMSLVRHLRGRPALDGPDYALCTEVLLRATGQRLSEAIARFRPSVLHFISHGSVQDGRAYIQLLDDEERGPANWTPEQLLSLLKDPGVGDAWSSSGGLPPVVVLNACHTGALPNPLRPTVSFAADLVRHGVPIVLGMWGRVADRACRAFTRSFYDALLRADSLTEAAASGRRKAFEGAGSPDSVDWAFPAIFTAEGVDSTRAFEPEAAKKFSVLQKIVSEIHRTNDPPVFCGRLEMMDHYRGLMRPASDTRILAIGAEEPGAATIQYGKTRVLEELAAKLVSDGHVPCFVVEYDKSKVPADRSGVGELMIKAIGEARTRFRLGTEYRYEWLLLKKKLRVAREGPQERQLDVKLSDAVADELDNVDPLPDRMEGLPDHVLWAALREDLAALANEAGQDDGSGRLRVVLLFDDVHRYGLPALEFLRDLLLETSGLQAADGRHYPAILAFRTGVTLPGDEANQPLIQKIKESGVTKAVELRAFAEPSVEPLPYEQLLKSNDPPLVVRYEVALAEDVKNVLGMLYEGSNKGIPSEFKGAMVRGMLVGISRLAKDTVDVAGDDDLIQQPAPV